MTTSPMILVQQDRRRWAKLLALVWVACGLALYSVPYLMIARTRAGLCPASAFLNSTNQSVDLLIYGPALLAALAAGRLLASVVFLLMDDAGAKWAATGGEARSPRAALSLWTLLLAGTLVLAVPVTQRNLYAGICAWPEGLSKRTGTLDSLRVFGWDRVTRIKVGCTAGKGGRAPYMAFMVDDGTVLDFWRSIRPAAAYILLEKPLAGVSFTFDNEGRQVCSDRDGAVFAHPPGK